MAEILLEIDCEEEHCGSCGCRDDGNGYCGAFQDFTDGSRLPECLNAQDISEDLLAEDDGE